MKFVVGIFNFVSNTPSTYGFASGKSHLACSNQVWLEQILVEWAVEWATSGYGFNRQPVRSS